MPRYFLDTMDDPEAFLDEEGTEFATVEDARRDLIRGMAMILMDTVRDGDDRAMAGAVRDEAGMTLCRVRLNLETD